MSTGEESPFLDFPARPSFLPYILSVLINILSLLFCAPHTVRVYRRSCLSHLLDMWLPLCTFKSAVSFILLPPESPHMGCTERRSLGSDLPSYWSSQLPSGPTTCLDCYPDCLPLPSHVAMREKGTVAFNNNFINVNLKCKQRGENETEKKKSWDEFFAWSCSFNSGEKDPLETVGNYSTISWVFSLIKRNIQSLLPWMLISIFPAYHCAMDTADVWPPVMPRWLKPRLSCEQGFCKTKRNVQIPSSILLSCHGLG